MSSPAQVRNVEAIEHFRNQLAKYEEHVQLSLESLTSELNRATNWLRNDRPSYWKKQTKRAEDAVHEAKMNLERCIMLPTVSGEAPHVAKSGPPCEKRKRGWNSAAKR